jgi:hypothetical protein
MRALGTGANSGQAWWYRFKDWLGWFKLKQFAHDELTPYSMLLVEPSLILPPVSLARISFGEGLNRR